MRKFLTISLILALLVTTSVGVWGQSPVLKVRWQGATNQIMLDQARKDLEKAKDGNFTILNVKLSSPGGPVLSSFEIARLVRDASDAGLIVEMHGEAIVASGGTFVLAAGTPGHRYISRWAYVVVHGLQRTNDKNEQFCLNPIGFPQNEDERSINLIIQLAIDHYHRYTGRSTEEIKDWITCGHERIGRGELAIELGLADKLE